MTFLVDNQGYYGEFGGAYIPEILHRCVKELQDTYLDVLQSENFRRQYDQLLRDYVGRPSPLYLAHRLSQQYGCKIYLKREDLNHTGAHKINNTIGQILLARHMGKKRIIAETGVKIDITDDGAVSVCGTDKEMIAKAIDMIKIITTDFEQGQILEGTVVSIKEFGAFIEFAPGKEGMVHISKIAKERINRVEDVLTLGDVVTVVCLGKDKMGRISFSMKDVAQQ